MMTTSTIRRRALLAPASQSTAVRAGASARAAAQSTSRSRKPRSPDIQQAIKAGQTTCRQVVQAYIERPRPTTAPAPRWSRPTASRSRRRRARCARARRSRFPTQTVAVSTIFPNFSEYAGLPFELGRMEPTLSDPGVQQQWGMRVGIPNAGQLNALETLNIRGERSVTCKGDFDRAPSAGPLPAGAPGRVRGVPQAAGRARAGRRARRAVRHATPTSRSCRCTAPCSRSRTGTTPRTCAAPAATTSTSRWTRRRSTRRTSPSCARRARSSTPSRPPTTSAAHRRRPGPEKPKTTCRSATSKYAQWGGQPCNPYDTDARAARHQRRLGRVGRRQPGDLLDLRAGLGLVQGPGVAQRRRQPADHQGHHHGRRASAARTPAIAPASTAGPCRDAVAVLDAIKGFESRRHLHGDSRRR